MNLDAQAIRAELQELAGNENVRVKLDKTLHVACSIRQTDHSYDITLNPDRVSSSQQLEQHLNMCRQAVTE